MSLSLQFEGQLALLEFNHGKANEMGRAELDAFDAMASQLQNTGARVLVSYSRRESSKGTPIFIAGANVTERRGWSQEQVAAHVRYQREVLARWRALPLLHIAIVNGVALGWGTEYLITADYRLATPKATFALPETGLGIIPGAGGTSELAAMIGLPQALRLGMIGERIDAEEAARIGLIQEVVKSVDKGLERALALANAAMRRSPTAVATFKRAALACVGRPPAVRQEMEAVAYEHCLEQGDAAVGREHFGAIRAGETPPWGDLQRFDP